MTGNTTRHFPLLIWGATEATEPAAGRHQPPRPAGQSVTTPRPASLPDAPATLGALGARPRSAGVPVQSAYRSSHRPPGRLEASAPAPPPEPSPQSTQAPGSKAHPFSTSHELFPEFRFVLALAKSARLGPFWSSSSSGRSAVVWSTVG